MSWVLLGLALSASGTWVLALLLHREVRRAQFDEHTLVTISVARCVVAAYVALALGLTSAAFLVLLSN